MDRTKAPEITHFSDISIHPERIIELPNGIDLHIVNFGTQPVTRLAMLWDGGMLDYPSAAAVSIMAATVHEATEYMSGPETADLIDYCGARLGGAVSEHHVSIELLAPNSTLPKLLPLMADFAICSAFPADAVESTAKRLAANRALQLERVAYIASIKLQSLLQGASHPASRVAMPMEYEAVDRDIVKMLYNIMTQSKLHVYVGGRLTDSQIEYIKEAFGGIPVGSASPVSIVPYEPELPRRVNIEKKDAMQSAVSIGLPAIPRQHPDYIDLRLAVMALGGYFGSRLMSNIREDKGLTYGISASLNGSYEGAYMAVNAQCDKKYVEQVVEETFREIKRLSSEPPAGDELERLRLHAWSSLASIADSPFSTLENYITARRVGIPENYFKDQLMHIAALNSDTIARVAGEYLNPACLSVVTTY